MAKFHNELLNLLDLPTEIIIECFIIIGISITASRSTSTKWNEITQSTHLWKSIHWNEFGSPLPTTHSTWEELVSSNYLSIKGMNINQRARWAIKTKNISLLKKMIWKGANLRFHLYGLSSAIYVSASNGDIQTTKLLLTEGKCYADDVKDREGSGLYVASQEGHIDTCKLLIAHGANIEFCFKEGYTPFYIACQRGRLDIVKYLYEEAGANPFRCCKYGSTPLYIACQEGHSDIVSYLLKIGSNIESHYQRGFTPLYVASRNNHIEVVRILLRAGANYGATNIDGYTPLYVACQYGHSIIARFLLDFGANPHSSFQGGYTPLYIACHSGHIDIVKMLTAILSEQKSSLNKKAPNGATSLYIASQNGYGDIVRFLCESGADPQITCAENYTPLYVASLRGHLDVIKVLLSFDHIDVNFLTDRQASPIYSATHQGHLDVVKLLVQANANINIPIQNGYTPLHIAVNEDNIRSLNIYYNVELKLIFRIILKQLRLIW